jgi:sialate O-acetylesterase
MTKPRFNVVGPLICGLGVMLSLAVKADVRLPAIFSDHMVLQRDTAVPVWGWAEPGEAVIVSIAGQTNKTMADAVGKWSVKLDKLSVGEPLTLAVTGKNTNTVNDVLVGEVWLCSGQSNMHFRMNRVENSREEIAAANHPKLRYFSTEVQFAQKAAADVQGTWKLVSPETAADCSAVAYYFGRALQQKINVPIGLLVTSVGGTKIEAWMNPQTLSNHNLATGLINKWAEVTEQKFKVIVEEYAAFQHFRDATYWELKRKAAGEGTTPPAEPVAPAWKPHTCPGATHFGMITPIQPFAIRGVLWYQGEGNVGDPSGYEKMQPLLISDWRRIWGDEVPFLFVQLPPYQGTSPAFREAQYRIWQQTPQTAMVGTTDVGDAKNVHPIRKRPVGERLALAARALSYGERVEYSGPVFKSLNVESNRAVVSFTHVGEGLMAQGGSLKGFTVAGADGKFIPARAVIDGSTVVVTSDKGDKPVAVRYGWATVPDVNLFNREGLPASPFRTDGHELDRDRDRLPPSQTAQ